MHPTLPKNRQLVQFRVREPNGDSPVLFGRFFDEDFSAHFICMRAPYVDDEREYIGRRYDPLFDVVAWHEGWE